MDSFLVALLEISMSVFSLNVKKKSISTSARGGDIFLRGWFPIRHECSILDVKVNNVAPLLPKPCVTVMMRG